MSSQKKSPSRASSKSPVPKLDEKKPARSKSPPPSQEGKTKPKERAPSPASSSPPSSPSEDVPVSPGRGRKLSVNANGKTDWACIDMKTIPAEVMEKVKTWKVKNVAVLHGDGRSKFNTSKIHRFTPPEPIDRALNWLIAQKAEEASLLFTNDSALVFSESKFKEFEDLSDD